MGRRLPPFPLEPHPLIHHALLLSFLAAWIAATIAVVSSLCGTCNPKSPPKSSPKSPPSPPLNNESNTKPDQETQTLEQDQEQHSASVPEEGTIVIEMAPGVATHGPLPPVALPASASRRRLSISLSSRLPEKMRASRKERHVTESEETIWKKTIILGEKCKVPSPSNEDEEDEAARNYHPRTPRSRPMSRTSSFANADAVRS